MPQVESFINIQGSRDFAYAMAKEMEKYPQYMESVQEVRILTTDPLENSTITQWVTNVDGRLIRWTEKDVFDDEAKTISYRQISGDLKKFEGEWRFQSVDGGTRVTLTVAFEFGIPMLAGLLNPILKKKTQANCDAMLLAIKEQVEKQSLVG
jgi:ribosome-associated toxin RatA of RatAB toxin-antitoxin module